MSNTLWGGARANGVVVGNVVLGVVVLGFDDWRVVGDVVLGTVVPVVAF